MEQQTKYRLQFERYINCNIYELVLHEMIISEINGNVCWINNYHKTYCINGFIEMNATNLVIWKEHPVYVLLHFI